MELDLNKKLALNYILEKMIEWEQENLRFIKNPKYGTLDAYVGHALQDEMKDKYHLNAYDFSLLLKRLQTDEHIIVGHFNTIKANIHTKEFLASGGYTQSKYFVWAKNPDNLWKILAVIIPSCVAIYLAFRK